MLILMPIIQMYTDGSCLDNSKCKQGLSFGGYGCHILYPMNEYEEFSGGIEGSKVTNNIGELMAYKKGLERLIQVGASDIVHVYSDSTYVINIFSKYIDTWIKYGWTKKTGKDIENLKLIKDIYKLIKDSNLVLIYKKVKAHEREPFKDSPKWYDWYGNDRADQLAKDCATDMKTLATSRIEINEKENSKDKTKRTKHNTHNKVNIQDVDERLLKLPNNQEIKPVEIVDSTKPRKIVRCIKKVIKR